MCFLLFEEQSDGRKPDGFAQQEAGTPKKLSVKN